MRLGRACCVMAPTLELAPAPAQLDYLHMAGPWPPVHAQAFKPDLTWLACVPCLQEYDGRIYLNVPASCTLMLVQEW